MSRGDENLDQMFKEAFSGQEHAFDPAFWQGVQPQLKTPVTPWYAGRMFLWIAAVTVLGITTLLLSDSTPDLLVQNEIQSESILEEQPSNSSAVALNDKSNESKSMVAPANQELNQKAFANDVATSNTNPINKSDNSIKTKHTLAGNTTSVSVKDGDTTTSNSSPNELNQMPVTKALHAINHGSLTIAAPQADNNIAHNSTTKHGLETASASTDEASDNNTLNDLNAKPTGVTSASFASHPKAGTNVKSQNGATSPPIQLASNSAINQNQLNQNNPSIPSQNTSLDWMKTKLMLSLPMENSMVQPKPNEFETHKSLNSPYTLRIMAGYMWSEPLNTNENGISNTATNTNIELSLEYAVYKRWGIQIGVDLNQLKENQVLAEYQTKTTTQFDYIRTPITVKDSTWWLGGWFNYPDQQDTLVDLQRVDRTDTILHKSAANQTMTWVEIPILATYSFNIHQFTVQIGTGASVGFLAGASGEYISYGDPVSVVPTQKSLFTTAQYNFLFRSELGYSITDHWQVNVRPQLKLNLNSINELNSGLNSRYLLYGINLGAAYRF